MPIKFRFKGGKIVSAQLDSLDEAVQFLKRFESAPPRVQIGPVTPPGAQIGKSARMLVRELATHPDGVSGSELAKSLEIDPKGLGPVVVSMLRWAKASGFARRDALVGERSRENGRLVRIFKLGAPLAKALKDGRITLD